MCEINEAYLSLFVHPFKEHLLSHVSAYSESLARVPAIELGHLYGELNVERMNTCRGAIAKVLLPQPVPVSRPS